LRSGDLSAVWVPDRQPEAMRELTRTREKAMNDLRASAFLLRWCALSTEQKDLGQDAHKLVDEPDV
jgi:hypothetical protein